MLWHRPKTPQQTPISIASNTSFVFGCNKKNDRVVHTCILSKFVWIVFMGMSIKRNKNRKKIELHWKRLFSLVIKKSIVFGLMRYFVCATGEAGS